MHSVLQLEATVLPGHRLEVSTPNLPEGTKVQIIVMAPTDIGQQSMLDLVRSLPPGPRLFQSPREAERFLQEERDSWDR